MKDVNRMLGERLRQIRREKKLTREKLAEMVEISPRFLADVEFGKAGVSLSNLVLLCRTLDVSADYLLGLTTESNDDKRQQLAMKIDRMEDRFVQPVIEIIKTLESIEEI